MTKLGWLIIAGLLIVLSGCDPVPVQSPPGPGQYPISNPNSLNASQPQPQVTGSQRWQHAWSKAMEGVAMGGSIAGPYGAGGGLIIGLITGLVTADSYYGELNAQIQTEQQKDKALEAAIEQEIERQRELENQIAGASTGSGSTAPRSRTAPSAEQPQPSLPPDKQTAKKPQDDLAVASINKPKPATAAPPPFKNVEVRDINGDGVPDLWIYYNPQKPGEIVRQEESTKGNGRVDTWSYFNDGKLVRREADTKGLGRPDTVFYYEGDKLAREERDETSRGQVTYRAIYDNGRIARVEKDTRASGRMDLWLYYDTNRAEETLVREEIDLNGDGVADLWTYYENGRVVRRDVSAVGLNHLTAQEKALQPDSRSEPIGAPRS